MADEEHDGYVDQADPNEYVEEEEDHALNYDAALAAQAETPMSRKSRRSQSFLREKKGLSRQRMIEYIGLQKWTRQSYWSGPFAVLIWLTVVLNVSLRSFSEAGFAVRSAHIAHFTDLQAVPTKGVAPQQILVTQAQKGSDIDCSCACAITADKLCNKTDLAMLRFNGSVPLTKLESLRARAAYFTDSAVADAKQDWSLRFTEIRTRNDVLLWLQHALLPDVWAEEGRDSPVVLTDVFATGLQKTSSAGASSMTSVLIPGVVQNWNQLVGGLRLRQRRLQSSVCRADSRVVSKYKQNCHNQAYSMTAFGPGLGSAAAGFVPEETDPRNFDIYYNIDSPLHKILENFQFVVKAYNWLDDATESLSVQGVFVNAEVTPAVLMQQEIRFDFERSGRVNTNINVSVVAIDTYPTSFHLILNLAWALEIVVLIVLRVMQAYKLLFRPRSNPAPFDIQTSLDWVNIVASFIMFVCFMVIQQEINGVVDQTALLPTAPPVGSSDQAFKTFVGKWSKILDDSLSVASFSDAFRIMLFWYTLVLVTSFWKIFSGQPKLAQLCASLASTAQDLIHFCLIFILLFVNFSFGGYMVWGLSLPQWSTPGQALKSTLDVFVGKADLVELFDIAPTTTVVWYALFIIIMIFVLMNLLVALTYDHYMLLKAQAGSATGIFSQVRFLLLDIFDQMREEGLLYKLTCCFRRPMHASSNVILEEMMERAAFPPRERSLVRESVLGSKWIRKDRDRAIFSGQNMHREVAADEDVGPDLRELLSPAYLDCLIERCKAYEKGEYDPEDSKTAQLRKLVVMAEDDILEMKTRLQACADYSRTNMHHITRRVDKLELLIHQILGELVAIAGDAGVPTSGTTGPMISNAKAQMASTVSSMGSTGAFAGSMQSSVGFKEVHRGKDGTIQAWHRAMRTVDQRSTRKGPGFNPKFYGPR